MSEDEWGEEMTDFNFCDELKKIYEKELLLKITNAGRIYRLLRARDKEFIRLLKEELNLKGISIIKFADMSQKQCEDIVDKLAGEESSQKSEEGKK